MSKGGQSQTTTTQPPSYQLPYLRAGLARAEQLYSGNQVNANGTVPQITTPGRTAANGAGGLYGAVRGNISGVSNMDATSSQIDSGALGAAPVAGFTPDQQASMDLTRGRALGGDPTIGAAMGYVQNSLNGGFLNSNPYIDETFNRAAQATQGQLASQFAGSGRNVDQSQGLRSQQLNDLATQIYGGNYANERQLQQGTLGYAQPLGNQIYTDAAQLGGIGSQQQQQQQRYLDAPGTALDQYLARVRGTDYGSSQRSTVPGNPVGGALGGASLGSAFGPWGTLIGGGLGAIFG